MLTLNLRLDCVCSELLDKVQSELGVQYPGIVHIRDTQTQLPTANFISHLFQGQLVSQVVPLFFDVFLFLLEKWIKEDPPIVGQ